MHTMLSLFRTYHNLHATEFREYGQILRLLHYK